MKHDEVYQIFFSADVHFPWVGSYSEASMGGAICSIISGGPAGDALSSVP